MIRRKVGEEEEHGQEMDCLPASFVAMNLQLHVSKIIKGGGSFILEYFRDHAIRHHF